ncbi:hypothetical protein HZ326_6898 [Fusarium oxysporum f. sp. albedinis]|nr:hypothetical protein HZ326_6898 [Fusarium oxysporum f. sp. albedinis]
MIAYVVQDLVYGIADASRFFVSLPLSGGLVPYILSSSKEQVNRASKGRFKRHCMYILCQCRNRFRRIQFPFVLCFPSTGLSLSRKAVKYR